MKCFLYSIFEVFIIEMKDKELLHVILSRMEHLILFREEEIKVDLKSLFLSISKKLE